MTRRTLGSKAGSRSRLLAITAASLLVAALAPATAAAKTILVVGPHEDDETFLGAGRIRDAVLAGDTVKVVLVTAGDSGPGGTADGYARMQTSVEAAQTLGLSASDVIFLGYGERLMLDLYRATDPSQILTSAAGQTATYGCCGLGGTDYHSYRYGAPAPYSRSSVLSDFEALLTETRPDEIYTVSALDLHIDHQATNLFITEALIDLNLHGAGLKTKLYQTMIWWPTDVTTWPEVDLVTGFTPTVPFYKPAISTPDQDPQLEWTRLVRFPVPAEMLTTDAALNTKYQAIQKYIKGDRWFNSWSRRDEFFWLSDFGTNVALLATAHASSETTDAGQTAAKAIDGVIDGSPHDPSREWVSFEQTAGAWIELTWTTAVRIAEVDLFDRPNLTDNITSGRLTFSDGTSISVGALPPSGKMLPVTFAPRTVTSVRFDVDSAAGISAGLSEIRVLGAVATSTANIPPHFLSGPTPASETIPASTSTQLSVSAYDLDGDAIQYRWSTDGGFVWSSGATATFVPPAVSAATYFTLTVEISDGRGGTARNSTFVQVTPAATDAISVNPVAVLSGDPSTGTVVLGTAAPSGGAVVALSTSDASVSVPPSVTVAAGATTATFPISTAAVASARAVSILADLPGGRRAASLTVAPASVASLTVAPSDVVGGSAAQGAVQLGAPAGAGGVVVQLSSGTPGVASVPASVTVPAGATRATFAISTNSVASHTVVALSATFGGTVGASLVVAPLELAELSFDSGSIVGGTNAQGTVTLNGPAAAGTQIALSSSAPQLASVPASVTIPQGASSATFTVTTPPVATSGAVEVTASWGGTSLTVALTVDPYDPPPPGPNYISGAESIGATPWQVGGDLAVTIGYAAAPDHTEHGNRAVSSGGGHGLSQLLTVSPGATYTFSFYARNHGGTGASYSVYDNTHFADIVAPTSYVSQLNAASYTRVHFTFTVPAGCTQIAIFPLRDSGAPVDVILWGAKLEPGSTLTPYSGQLAPSVAALTLATGSALGGNTVQGTVSALLPADPPGMVVALSSSNPAVAAVPASVTIPAGASSVSFSVTTAAVLGPTPVTITAYYRETVATTLTVGPLGVATLVLAPSSVTGGGASVGTVALNGTAGQGGALVALASDDATVTVPDTVLVPAGSASATFAVSTTSVSAPELARVSARGGGASVVATLAVTPTVDAPVNANLLLEPEQIGTVPWYARHDMTVTMNAAAAPDGTQHASRAVSSGLPQAITQLVKVIPGATYTFSFFARNNGGTGASYSIYDDDQWNDIVPATAYIGQLAGGGWVRVSTTFTIPASGTNWIRVLPVRDSGAPVDLFLWGAKLELGSTATPYVPMGTGSLRISPSAVQAGAASQGTVYLDAPAQSPTAIPLVSSAPSVASVPASVTVATGSSTATFPITTHAVSTSTVATITATFAVGPQAAVLTVAPQLPSISALGLSPASVLAGASSTATVTLSAPAPAGGAVITLASSATSAVVPGTVTVAAGATSATFAVTTGGVAADSAVSISASYAGQLRIATLTVTSASLTGVSVTPTSVAGGTAATGTVTLDGPAPAGGFEVALSSDDSNSASVPASVIVGAGATSAQFTVTTYTVAGPTVVRIGASLRGQSFSTTLAVTTAGLAGVSVSPTSVTGGTGATGTVTLTGPAPLGGVAVSLSSGSSAATVGSAVTVASGATSATFPVATSPVAASTAVTLTATYGASRTATLTVAAPTLTGLSLGATTLVGGTSAVGTLTMGSACAAGTNVTLTSNDPSVVVPATVTMIPGSASTTFPVTTYAVSSNRTVTISASFGSVTLTQSLVVGSAALKSVSISPKSVGGGASATGTVTLTGRAPTGGATVSLQSSVAGVTVPASVAVAEGAVTGTFTVATSAVASSVTATITAFYGATRTDTVTVTPPALSALSVSPTTVNGGASATGTVTLTGVAPSPDGITVALASNNGAASVPASVLVQPNQSTATFTVTTTAVTSDQNVRLTASLSGTSQTTTLGILAPVPTSLAINPRIVYSGNTATGTVTLSSPTTGTYRVRFSSSNTAAATVPSYISLPVGSQTVSFTITALPVTTNTTVTITATGNGVPVSLTVSIRPILAAVTVTPTSTVGGSQPYPTGTVTLAAAAPTGGLNVSLSSSDAPHASVPASVTVSAGATTATFGVTTTTVATSTPVTLSASTSGGATRTATLTLSP
jgi:LmbE family N-acetylglucosaminyl deacetylase